MSERFAGRFAILHSLGRGGMGEVFLARDLASGDECAIKRLDVLAEPELVDRLRSEFEALSRLRHPAIVEVRELGFTADGRPFLVMEYVPGLPADRALARGDWAPLFWTAAHVAHGLEALHAQGIAHGDVKPQNLLITPAADPMRAALPTDVRLVDFGLAALAGRTERGGAGTMGFTAPEVARGGVANAASDLYGFGATLYALATGRNAFGSGPASSILRRQSDGPPPIEELERAGTPEGLVQLVLRLMAPNPAERPASAREVRIELAALHPAARRPLRERLETDAFVGRARESARIAAAWESSAHHTQSLILQGPSGIGKTSLLARTAARASLAKHPVLRAAHPLERTPGAVATALFRRLAAEAGASTIVDGDTARIEEAALRLATIAPAGKPALVIVDDADDLDDRSLALLLRLVLHPRRPPSLWLWARRADGDTPLDVAADAGAMERLVLGPLAMDVTERLVAARLSDTPPSTLAPLLHERAQGHPGLVVEMLRLAAREGAIEDSEAGVVARTDALLALHLPADFEEASLGRLRSLGDEAQESVRRLAACGGSASDADFAAMGARIGSSLAREVSSSGLASRDAEGVWRLTPPSIGAAILARATDEARRSAHERSLDRHGLPDAERFRLLHELGRTSEALEAAERAFAGHASESLASRAAALAEAHAPALASEWWLRAGALARSAGRYSTAAALYAHAVAATESAIADERAGTAPAGARGRAWEGLTVSLLRSGQLKPLEDALGQALAEPLHPVIRAHLLVGHAALADYSDRVEELEKRVPVALDAARSSADPEAIALALLSRSALEHRRGHGEASRATLAEAASHAERSGSLLLEFRLKVYQLTSGDPRQDSDAGLQSLRGLVEQLRTEGRRFAVHEGLFALVNHLVKRGAWREAMDAASEDLRIAIEDGRRGDACVALANMALIDALTGQPSSARRRARALVRFDVENARRVRVPALRAMARASRARGSARRAEQLARRAVRLAQQVGNAQELDWARLELISTLTASDRWAEAAPVARASVNAAPPDSVGRAILETFAGRCALRAAALADTLAEAAARLGRVDAWLAREQAPYARAHAAILRAELALRRDDATGASGAVREATEIFERLPCPADRALALLEISEQALERPIASQLPVHGWLMQAREVFERFRDGSHCVRALKAELRAHPDWDSGRPDDWNDRDLVEAITGVLSSLSDLPQLSKRALELAGRRFGADRGVLVLRDPATGALDTLAEYGSVTAKVRERALSYSTRIVHEVTQSGVSLIIRDLPTEGGILSYSQEQLGLQALLCVPLSISGTVSGAMYMDSRVAGKFTEADRGLLQAFSSLIGLAIERGRGQAEVERNHDQLVDENVKLRKAVGELAKSDELILGAHPRVRRMVAEIHQAARTPRSSVLITGETGAGKELVAQRIHALSSRREGRFVALNCAATPEGLLADQLFGHERGAFSDAYHDRVGDFERANGGTLFLDEIGDMPLEQQVSLLRVLQTREIQRLGGTRAIPVDVRVIAATNRDLKEMVQARTFRDDLYHRLHVIPIDVPALRDRKSDIPMLVDHFVRGMAQEMERPAPGLSKELMAAVMRSNWPGNIRELEHYIERLMAMTPGDVLFPDPLPNDLAAGTAGVSPALAGAQRFEDAVEVLEIRLIKEALEQSSGNQSQAARILEIPESKLRYRLRKYSQHFPR